MSLHDLDRVHDHVTMGTPVRPEFSDDGRLHRHRVPTADGSTRYTTWEHDTHAHAHRLPDGAWTRPRRSLTPPRPLEVPVL